MLSEVYARVRETGKCFLNDLKRTRRKRTYHIRITQKNKRSQTVNPGAHPANGCTQVAPPNFANDMAEVLANIFVAAGFKETLTALQLQIVTCFGERIHMVMQCAQQLNKTIGELGVTSCDLENSLHRT
jgi:hypothetical protein